MRSHKLPANQLKRAEQHGKTFAAGGKTHMAKPQAAGPVRPGVSGKSQTAAPGGRAAAGGPPIPPRVSKARPAKGGVTR